MRRARDLHRVARPWRARRVKPEPPHRRLDALKQLAPRPDRPALLAAPRPDAALPGTQREVVVALALRHLRDPPLNTRLPIERIPVPHHRPPRVHLQRGALPRAVVGEKHHRPSFRRDALAQHDSRRRPPVRIDRRERHRIRVRRGFAPMRILVPGAQQRKRIRRQPLGERFALKSRRRRNSRLVKTPVLSHFPTVFMRRPPKPW